MCKDGGSDAAVDCRVRKTKGDFASEAFFTFIGPIYESVENGGYAAD